MEVFDYSESVLGVIMTTLRQNPYKYSELFEVFGKILRWNQKNDTAINFIK